MKTVRKATIFPIKDNHELMKEYENDRVLPANETALRKLFVNTMQKNAMKKAATMKRNRQKGRESPKPEEEKKND